MARGLAAVATALGVLVLAAEPDPLPGGIGRSLSVVAGIAPMAAGLLALVLGLLAARRRPRRVIGLVVVAGLMAGIALGGGYDFARTPLESVGYGVLGLLLGLVWRGGAEDLSRWTTGLALLTTLAIADELVQWWVPGRHGGAEDLSLAVVGAACGLAFLAVVVRSGELPLRFGRDGWTATLRAGAGVVALLGLFVHLVHLGHRIPVAAANASFRSHFRAAELMEMDLQWRPAAEPSGLLGRLAVGSDRYLEEARWHAARAANLAAVGERAQAWQERRILAVGYPAAASYLGVAVDPRDGDAEAEAVARRVGRDLGPAWLVTRIGAWTLWLACTSLGTGLLLVAEAIAFGRGTP